MTTDEHRTVEPRIADLVDDLRLLGLRVDDLTSRLAVLESGRPVARVAESLPAPMTADDESGTVLGWVGHSHALQQIAVISFVLVVALVLRTLTDDRVLGKELGVVSGVLYSVLLVAWGSRRLAQRRPHELLAACGGALLCSVGLEAHRTFGVLSPGGVCWLLLADLAVLTAVGLRWRSVAPLAVAALGTTVAALATNFPDPAFVLVAILLLCANLVPVAAQRLPSTQWLRWTTFLLTLFFWLQWSLKVRAACVSSASAHPGLAQAWFLPSVGVFALLFAAAPLLRFMRAGADEFDAFLPLANVSWAYAAAAAVVGRDAAHALGTAGLLVAVLHLAAAGVLWRRCRGSTGVTTFLLAGTLLAVVAIPSVLDSLALVLPVWATLAVGLGVAATSCNSAGLRIGAQLLQCLVAVTAVAGGLFEVPAAQPPLQIGAAVAVAVLGLLHYRWNRTHPLPAVTLLARLEAAANADILLLWAAAVSTFGHLRLLAFGALGSSGPSAYDAFWCAQSVLINLGSIALMLWGLRAREPQVLATAALVATVGGLKVIGVDLMSSSGVPLVMSVFSFGMAAATGSIVLGRWQAWRGADRSRSGRAQTDAT